MAPPRPFFQHVDNDRETSGIKTASFPLYLRDALSTLLDTNDKIVSSQEKGNDHTVLLRGYVGVHRTADPPVRTLYCRPTPVYLSHLGDRVSFTNKIIANALVNTRHSLSVRMYYIGCSLQDFLFLTVLFPGQGIHTSWEPNNIESFFARHPVNAALG